MSHFQLTNSLLFSGPKPPAPKKDQNSIKQNVARMKREDRAEAISLGLSWPGEYCDVMGVSYDS